jgi:8-oxo-dGTP pyrophosphatase MutT (NUDIX family)
VESGPPLECVALLLVRDRQVLAERRKRTKRLALGAVAIPGGHIDPGERPGHALTREAREEFGIVLRETAFVCTLMHLAEELRTLHYYAVRSWGGDIVPEEAEAVLWLPLDAVQRLDLDVDRTAVNEYQRLTREGGLVWRTNR